MVALGCYSPWTTGRNICMQQNTCACFSMHAKHQICYIMYLSLHSMQACKASGMLYIYIYREREREREREIYTYTIERNREKERERERKKEI